MEEENKRTVEDERKERWLREDKKCPSCGSVIEEAKGFNKQNIKKLFSFNFKRDWFETVLIIGVLLLVLAYNHDTAVCRQLMTDPVPFCLNVTTAYNNQMMYQAGSDFGKYNNFSSLPNISRDNDPLS